MKFSLSLNIYFAGRYSTAQCSKGLYCFLLLPVIPSNLGLNSELEQKRARKWRWQIYVAQIMQKYQHPPSAGRVADSFSAKSWRKSGSLNENRQIYEAPIICLTKKISVPPHRLLLGSSLKISNPPAHHLSNYSYFFGQQEVSIPIDHLGLPKER